MPNPSICSAPGMEQPLGGAPCPAPRFPAPAQLQGQRPAARPLCKQPRAKQSLCSRGAAAMGDAGEGGDPPPRPEVTQALIGEPVCARRHGAGPLPLRCARRAVRQPLHPSSHMRQRPPGPQREHPGFPPPPSRRLGVLRPSQAVRALGHRAARGVRGGGGGAGRRARRCAAGSFAAAVSPRSCAAARSWCRALPAAAAGALDRGLGSPSRAEPRLPPRMALEREPSRCPPSPAPRVLQPSRR